MPKTIEINLTKEEFNKLLEVDEWDRVMFCDDSHRCFTVYNLLEASEVIKPEFMYNKNDCVSVWKCQCGNIFQTKHQVGVLDGTDVNFCCRCGVKYDWKGE